MWRNASGMAVIAGLLCLPAIAQTPAQRSEAEIEAARTAQGYTPTRLWERPDVRATRVDLKPMATRAVHQHDDVKFHLFIPLAGTLQLMIGSDKPVDAPVGQAFFIKGGTPHGFRNLGSTPGMAMEIFVKDGVSTASLDAVGAWVAALQTSAPRPSLAK
jgi:mannose-6-phosphate isomerase-like protein (cupin superfamily)